MKPDPDKWNILRKISDTVKILLVFFIVWQIAVEVAGKNSGEVLAEVPVSPSTAQLLSECAFFDSECPISEKDLNYVVDAMRELASTEGPGDLDILMDRRGMDPRTLADLILRKAKEHRLDPLLLVSMAWIETRFDPKAVSDYEKRPKEGRNCGLLQVRTDLPGRPSCEKMRDPEANLNWAANHIRQLATSCKGEICLVKYNAGDYEDRVWRKLDWLRRRMWVKASH